MRYVVDLHSHSGYAGGVGDISLDVVADTMAAKGINAFGIGDCLQPAWLERLGGILEEREPGLFALRSAEGSRASARFVMQTEIIITSPVASGGRKGTHVVLLFPGLAAAAEALRLLRKWDVKVDMGRPFVKCEDAADVEEKCRALMAIDPLVMIIPAHVLTPQGVYGSDHPVDSLSEVFGGFARDITTVETGLSADPALLALLPELDDKSLISNSDCHSGALNRVGREFTALELNGPPSYGAVIEAIRNRKITYTAEFNPAEGRYFLTGHRAGLQGHGDAYCYYSPGEAPDDGRCCICGKKLTIGVLDRILFLAEKQSRDGTVRSLDTTPPRQASRALVPLVEVIAHGLGIKSVSGKKVVQIYHAVVSRVGTEAELWDVPSADLAVHLRDAAPEPVVEAIRQVSDGNFSFQPGFDGTYGGLRLGERIDWLGHKVVVNQGG